MSKQAFDKIADGLRDALELAKAEPRKFCWHCSRSYTEDDVQIIWAEANCTRWSTCPFNLIDGEP